MRLALTLLASAFLGAPALAQTDAQLAESRRYEACLDLVETDPSEAFEDALLWRNEGGDWPSEHCHARALVAMGETERGTELIESIASIQRRGMVDHERLALWLEAGELWLDQNNFVSAESAFSVALALDTESALALDGRARSYLGLQLWNDAASDAAALTANLPNWADGWRYLAEAELERGHPTEAQSAIIAALRIDPANIDALVLRGRINEAMRMDAETD